HKPASCGTISIVSIFQPEKTEAGFPNVPPSSPFLSAGESAAQAAPPLPYACCRCAAANADAKAWPTLLRHRRAPDAHFSHDAHNTWPVPNKAPTGARYWPASLRSTSAIALQRGGRSLFSYKTKLSLPQENRTNSDRP